jgi:hypothetical protein
MIAEPSPRRLFKAGANAASSYTIVIVGAGSVDGRFPDRQVSTKGTDKPKVEALSFAHLRK